MHSAPDNNAVVANNFADPVLLNKIDKLFACGVGDYIALPQLVVVGDQSSGKSSVLQGLTNLPFPRDSGLCTRFATQITFRRTQETSISVSVIAASTASPEHAARVQAWSKTGITSLDAPLFAEIMTEVHDLMNLGGQDNSGSRSTFSEDVLRLEICGPDQEHFSVVDVPGIFRKTTEGVTTVRDKEMVTDMVIRYMANPRSVMLTVIPANVDIATQEILSMAENYDKDGHRTLGVLTKPDLVDTGAETPVMELVEGKRHKLNLGWCMVRNLGQGQLSDPNADRAAVEARFFSDRSPWNKLDKERVGVAALRSRLQEILASNIRQKFPKVKSEIHKKLIASKQAMNKLGPKRDTTQDQRRYLMDFSMDFQKIAGFALNANYVGSDWFDQYPTLKFATAVVNRNEVLEEAVKVHGHLYDFEGGSPRAPVLTPPHEKSEASSDSGDSESEHVLAVRTTENHGDLEDMMPFCEDIEPSTDCEIRSWLKGEYTTSRGFELGTFGGSLLATTIKTQSSNWVNLAVGYVADVVSMAHSFILALLDRICPNSRVRDGIVSVMLEPLRLMYKRAIDHADFLLEVERMGTPTTLNHYFNDNLEKSRRKRMQADLEGKANGDSKVSLDDILQCHQNLSNVDHVVREIHDILEAYYKVARKRFVDNLCMQAADYHLVTGPHTPLKLFSPTFVDRLTVEQLEDIAGEDALTKRKRAALEKEIGDLEAGRKILT